MTNLLTKIFIKDYKNVNNPSVREAYGVLGGIVGMVCNIVLFIVKLAVGITISSVSVVTDSFNNLSDVGSSLVTLIGSKFGNKPADKEHPFGHGRVEYIASLIISFIILFVGLQFFIESVSKIFNPESIYTSGITVIILLVSIGIKLWLSIFNRKLGKAINSLTLTATSLDSLSDVIATSSTIISLAVFHFLEVNIDGYIGCFVAALVLLTGISIAKETLNPLIGQSINNEIAQQISDILKGYEEILDVHDLIIHTYGPGRSMASIHAEVPDNLDIHVIHEVIDSAERSVSQKLGIEIVIHMDPVAVDDKRIHMFDSIVENIIKDIDPSIRKHDFRVVDGERKINFIFDIEIPYDYNIKKQKYLIDTIKDRLKKIDTRYDCIINIDKSYINY